MQLRSGTSIPPYTALSTEITASRKRSCPIGSESNPTTKRFKLTTSNLIAHTRSMMPRPPKRAAATDTASHQSNMTGVDDQSASLPAPSSTATSKSRRITSSHHDIVPILIKTGIDPFQFPRRRPEDFDNIRFNINHRRVSESPTESEFETHCADLNGPLTGSEALADTTWRRWIDQRPSHDEQSLQYSRTYKDTWSGFIGMELDGRPVTTAPDFAHCRLMYGIPDNALNSLGSAIQPSPSKHFMMPHAIAEHKAPSLSVDVATYQTALDGAIIVQGDQMAFQYSNKPFPARKTRAISAAYNGNHVRLDAHYFDEGKVLPMRNHVILDAHYFNEGKHLPYAHTVIGDYSTCSSLEDYRRGRRAVRNMLDFGRGKTEEVYDMLAATERPLNATTLPSPPGTEDEPPPEDPEWQFTKDFWYRQHPDGTIEYHNEAVHGEPPLHSSLRNAIPHASKKRRARQLATGGDQRSK